MTLLCLLAACESQSAIEHEGEWPTIVEGKVQPLAVAARNGKDLVWSPAARRNITYCIEPGQSGRYGGFGSDTSRVKTAARAAGDAWSAVADVDFDFVDTTGCDYCDPRVTVADTLCTDSKQVEADFAIVPFMNIVSRTVINDDGISVTTRTWVPVAGSEDDARATFVPGLIITTDNFFGVKVGAGLYTNGTAARLSQIMTHEFGHTLGFLHEHQRSDVPKHIRGQDCPATPLVGTSLSVRGVTMFDSRSVMHYPAVEGYVQCGGRTDGIFYEMSFMDKMGAPCIYGEPGTGRIPGYCSVLTVMPTVEGAYLAATTTISFVPFTGIDLGPIIGNF